MINFINVSIQTRHPILLECNFTFKDNQIYGLIAQNGFGKTTIFRVMTDLLPITKGKILYDGVSFEKVKQNVFYFETSEWLDGNLNGMDYFQFVKKTWKSNIDINEVIQYWKMNDYIKVPIKKYSLGMKQRLLIGLYMVSDVKYMIMDEITNGLDQESRERFFNMLKEMKRRGKTIILSSHYQDELVDYCDSLVSINNWTLCGE